MEKEKKAALYTRVSTIFQVDKDSLPHQKHALIEYIKYVLHIEKYEIFEDAGFSGKNTNRPAYQEMMTRIRAGEFTHLVVNKIDRISRNLLDFAAMYEELKKCNVIFVSRNEQFDTSNAMGEAMLKIILVFAELERRMTSERVSAVLLDRAKKGKKNGGTVPFGYRLSAKKEYPEIYEPEAKIVRFIFSQYILDGMSVIKIARYLNEHHISTKLGASWRSATLSILLRNPFYKGVLRYNRRDYEKHTIRPKEQWVVVENNHPALISPELWDKVQEKLSERRTNKHLQKGKYVHIFSDILYCLCGARLKSQKNKPRHKTDYVPSYYSCSHYVENCNIETRCDNNKFTGDKVIGTFIFTYMQNMLSIQQNIYDYRDPVKMEHRLLQGKVFGKIKSIEADSMKNIYKSFMMQSHIDYQQEGKSENVNIDDEAMVKERLLKEKESHERAIERLNRAYLYNDAGFSEEFFFTERNKILNDLNSVKKKLASFEQQKTVEQKDYDFLDEASDYLLKSSLLSKETVVWNELAQHVDEKILRHFFRTVLNRVILYKGNILSIEFRNGVTHHFLYRQ